MDTHVDRIEGVGRRAHLVPEAAWRIRCAQHIGQRAWVDRQDSLKVASEAKYLLAPGICGNKIRVFSPVFAKGAVEGFPEVRQIRDLCAVCCRPVLRSTFCTWMRT